MQYEEDYWSLLEEHIEKQLKRSWSGPSDGKENFPARPNQRKTEKRIKI